MLTIYGIPNCDTMKKARRWLDDHDVAYEFHDYKKKGIDGRQLRDWVARVGWETLLNRRGMMWRKLDENRKKQIDETSAIEIMLEVPAIIKRPVLVTDKGDVMVGFNEAGYQALID
jgi:Spx/MgsR family transcriptional regulator